MYHEHLPPIEVGTGILFRKGKRMPVIVEGKVTLSTGDTIPCNLNGTIVTAEIVGISNNPQIGMIICIEYRPQATLEDNILKFEPSKEATAP